MVRSREICCIREQSARRCRRLLPCKRHVGREFLARSREAARFIFSVWTAEYACGGFEEDGVRDVAAGVSLRRGVLMISRRVTEGCGRCTGRGSNGREEGCEGILERVH